MHCIEVDDLQRAFNDTTKLAGKMWGTVTDLGLGSGRVEYEEALLLHSAMMNSRFDF